MGYKVTLEREEIMLPVTEIPTADALRINTIAGRKGKLDAYLRSIKLVAAEEMLKDSKKGNCAWVIPYPFGLCGVLTEEVILQELRQIFCPLGYTVINHNPTSPYISISWKER